MGVRARSAALVLSLVTVGLSPFVAFGPADRAMAVPTDNCAKPGTQSPAIPWAQRQLDFERAWTLSQGAGVKVAVLASGVDANQPSLRGHVIKGADFLQAGDGRADCAGGGTQVAGVIAAQANQGVPFHGVAPGATILPVRVTDEPESTIPGKVAAGVNFAVSNGARIIVVPMAVYVPDPGLQQAVANAVAHDVLVVAGVGEDAGSNGLNRTPYPAGFPGVLGVAAIDETSAQAANSGMGAFVDMAAPGDAVVTTQRGSGLVAAGGTGLAAGFVAGAAALVRSRWPDLAIEGVFKRLTAAATPAPGGLDNAHYGYGIVNPYGAVVDLMATAGPAPVAGFQHDAEADRRRAASWSSSATLALGLTAIGILLAFGAIGLSVALPRGRRARWRARAAAPPDDHPEDEEPGPPVRLFADREA
jgi:membrane-anchored mycosin MYCP